MLVTYVPYKHNIIYIIWIYSSFVFLIIFGRDINEIYWITKVSIMIHLTNIPLGFMYD